MRYTLSKFATAGEQLQQLPMLRVCEETKLIPAVPDSPLGSPLGQSIQ